MPPTPKTASPTFRSRYCGLGNHHLRPPHKKITDDKMLRFAKYINPELRSTTLLCGSCFDTLQKIYRVKMQHAMQLHRGKKRATVQTNSISDVSSSQQQSQSASVLSAPSTTSSSTTSLTTVNEVTTSTSIAPKRKRTDSPSGSKHAADDEDDESMLSLNAVNGTRLPHVQPIPKRRQTVHLNQPAMDIYLAGTTGG